MLLNRKANRTVSITGCAGALVLLLLLAACQNNPFPLRESSAYEPSERNYAGICSSWASQGRKSKIVGSTPQYRCQHPYSLPQVAAAVEVVEVVEIEPLGNEPGPARLELSIAPVLFGFDSAVLLPAGEQELRSAATLLREHPATTILLRGYTDSTGTAAYNQGLSVRRAAAAERFFVGQGIDDERLTIRGYGENDPAASNATPAGRQQNRRVEIDVP